MLGLKKSFIRNDFQHQQLDLARGERKENETKALEKNTQNCVSQHLFWPYAIFSGPF